MAEPDAEVAEADLPFTVTVTPNPFNPQTTIKLRLTEAGAVDVKILDISGRLVNHLYSGRVASGALDLVWQGTDGEGRRVASGVYFYRVVAGQDVWQGKLALLK